jgi:hypothetical protein
LKRKKAGGTGLFFHAFGFTALFAHERVAPQCWRVGLMSALLPDSIGWPLRQDANYCCRLPSYSFSI